MLLFQEKARGESLVQQGKLCFWVVERGGDVSIMALRGVIGVWFTNILFCHSSLFFIPDGAVFFG
ncbi:MAG: hypothetical protein QG632_542 [Candidatus Dependentiae bacterium]|nr:hypothetical protein [Candidatus Dependentiae bacterium]